MQHSTKNSLTHSAATTEKYSKPHQANNFLDVQVRVEDPDDHLPGDGVAGVHGQPLDHRLLDAEAVREVKTFIIILLELDCFSTSSYTSQNARISPLSL